jgi:hypothetical protein
MATKNQIAANRLNALRSTGPRTEEGKAITRYNALTHGLLASDVVLRDENRVDFDKFRDGLASSLPVAPEGQVEFELLDQLALRMWRLRRCARIEAGLFNNLFREEDVVRAHDRLGAAFAHGAETFACISRYEAQMDRSALKILGELRRLGEERVRKAAADLDKLRYGLERRQRERTGGDTPRDPAAD